MSLLNGLVMAVFVVAIAGFRKWESKGSAYFAILGLDAGKLSTGSNQCIVVTSGVGWVVEDAKDEGSRAGPFECDRS